MADTKTAPAADNADKKLVKPEKPSEEEYNAALKKAEKDHADSMARFVSGSQLYKCRMPMVASDTCMNIC
jgi:hypothetical protein